MASNSYLTSQDLIDSIKRRASIPEAQETFDEQDFLDLLNEEMSIGLVPSVLQYHEEYLVRSEDVPLATGQLAYPIPYRAIGNRLRDLTFVDTSGNEFEMTRVADSGNDYDRPEADFYIRRFRVEGGNVVLFNGNSTNLTGTLRFYYFMRPNLLVSMDRGAQIAAIDRNTGIITFSDTTPSHFTTNLFYDFNRTKSDHRIIDFDTPVTAVTTVSVTFNVDDIPASLEVGDFICQSGETVVPNIPTDLHVVLAHRGATRCLEAMGDTQGLQNANTKLVEMETKMGSLIDNRVEGAPLKVVNRYGLLKPRRFRW